MNGDAISEILREMTGETVVNAKGIPEKIKRVNRDKTSDADKPNTAVQTDAQGEVNEQEIEDNLNELDENADNEDKIGRAHV